MDMALAWAYFGRVGLSKGAEIFQRLLPLLIFVFSDWRI